MKKGQNGRESLRRLKPIVDCKASKRRRRKEKGRRCMAVFGERKGSAVNERLHPTTDSVDKKGSFMDVAS